MSLPHCITFAYFSVGLPLLAAWALIKFRGNAWYRAGLSLLSGCLKDGEGCTCALVARGTGEGLVEEDPKLHGGMDLGFYLLQMPDANGRGNLF